MDLNFTLLAFVYINLSFFIFFVFACICLSLLHLSAGTHMPHCTAPSSYHSMILDSSITVPSHVSNELPSSSWVCTEKRPVDLPLCVIIVTATGTASAVKCVSVTIVVSSVRCEGWTLPLIHSAGNGFNSLLVIFIMNDAHDFGKPFDAANADIILCYVDGTDFRAHRAVIAQCLPLFALMFSLRPPAPDSATSVSEDKQKNRNAIIAVAENKDALHHVLINCYPAFLDALDSIDAPSFDALSGTELQPAMPIEYRQVQTCSSFYSPRVRVCSWLDHWVKEAVHRTQVHCLLYITLPHSRQYSISAYYDLICTKYCSCTSVHASEDASEQALVRAML